MTFDEALAVLRDYRAGSAQPWPRFYEAIDIVLEEHRAKSFHRRLSACPFCGSSREPVVKEADETFEARYGCADCDKWWGPVVLKPDHRRS